jgi:alanyl-tRNA synthetase
VSKDLQAAGVSAADVVRPAAEIVGGGTGRNTDTAMAGGPRGDGVDDALDAGRAVLEDHARATAGSGAAS